jgi:hypothetical protein
MKRSLLAALGLSVVFAAAPGSALGAADVFSVGGGWIGDKAAHFSLSAHDRPTGDFGQVTVNEEALSYRVDVKCVFVFGMRATIAGFVDRVSANTLGVDIGDPAIFFAGDGGQPSGEAPVDDLRGDFAGDGLFCELPFVFAPNVTQGNININFW